MNIVRQHCTRQREAFPFSLPWTFHSICSRGRWLCTTPLSISIPSSSSQFFSAYRHGGKGEQAQNTGSADHGKDILPRVYPGLQAMPFIIGKAETRPSHFPIPDHLLNSWSRCPIDYHWCSATCLAGNETFEKLGTIGTLLNLSRSGLIFCIAERDLHLEWTRDL